MKTSSVPELDQLPVDERRRVLVEVTPAIFKDPRVWGSYAAQIVGFILIFFVLFPAAQPRLVLIAVYALITLWLVRRVHQRVMRERVVAFLRDKRSAQSTPSLRPPPSSSS